MTRTSGADGTGFGGAVVKAREICGEMTQDELSEKSGINQSRISRIENNDSAPVTVEEAEAIAKAVGLTLSQLLSMRN